MNNSTDFARSIAAVFAGFIFFFIIWALLTWLTLKVVAPGALQGTVPVNALGYLIAMLVPGTIAPFAAGFLTGLAAGRAPVIHALPLSLILLGMSLFRVATAHGQVPMWYLVTFCILTTLAPLAGGYLRRKS